MCLFLVLSDLSGCSGLCVADRQTCDAMCSVAPKGEVSYVICGEVKLICMCNMVCPISRAAILTQCNYDFKLLNSC